MGNIKPTQIFISGNVVVDKFCPNTGDIYLYRKDDASGRAARAGGHPNFGYSGYYLASIFDGNDWRKLQLNKLITYENRSYEQAQECPRVVAQIGSTIRAWSGSAAVYDETSRSFHLHNHEITGT